MREKSIVQDRWIEELETRKSTFRKINERPCLPIQKIVALNSKVKFSPKSFVTTITVEPSVAGAAVGASQMEPARISPAATIKQKKHAANRVRKAASLAAPIESVLNTTIEQKRRIVEDKIQKLDELIDLEIKKSDSNVQVLIQRFRERRQTIGLDGLKQKD